MIYIKYYINTLVMNIASFGFRSVDDTPITQPNLTPSKEIKSKRKHWKEHIIQEIKKK